MSVISSITVKTPSEFVVRAHTYVAYVSAALGFHGIADFVINRLKVKVEVV